MPGETGFSHRRFVIVGCTEGHLQPTVHRVTDRLSSLLPLLRAAATASILVVLAACSTSTTLSTARAPAPISTAERHASIVVDVNSREVLYSTRADELRFPASLTKMMTAYMVFEALETGRLSLDTQIPVSRNAASRPPSKLFLRAGSTIDVDTAIRALCTKSANDVATAVAEFLGGSEEQFARLMTLKARQLGMRSTTFRNASGLPDPAQVTTARDMAVLGMALRSRFPQHYRYFSETELTYNGKTIEGHNNILKRVRGADGIKTGYTRASGFNLVSSVGADGKRIVAVIMGEDSARQRDDLMESLIASTLPRARRG